MATEQEALTQGKSRKQAIYAAYGRFYKGDIAQEIARSTQEQGGLITAKDLADWQVKIEEPVSTSYKGIDVYKLTVWTQGPAMLQTLNILENFDLKPMGYDTSRYINTLYQAMSLAFADRDFYYGDPYFPPTSPVEGLLSKAYAKERAKLIDPARSNPGIMPGDPYPFQGGVNPYAQLLARWKIAQAAGPGTDGTLAASVDGAEFARFREGFTAGTTSVEAADSEGWVVSVTPSGGWLPAVIAGHTGIGLSPAHAVVRPRPRRVAVQRGGAGPPPAGDADAHPGAQGRQAVPLLLGAGRRQPGPEPAAVLPRRGRSSG